MNAESAILAKVNDYFVGLYGGGAVWLATLFHTDCVLKAPQLRRTLDNWLSDVSSRPVPRDTGQPWNYEIIRVEVEGA